MSRVTLTKTWPLVQIIKHYLATLVQKFYASPSLRSSNECNFRRYHTNRHYCLDKMFQAKIMIEKFQCLSMSELSQIFKCSPRWIYRRKVPKMDMLLPLKATGHGLKVVPRLRECCKQSQAEVVSKSRNKIHQTWGPPFSLVQ